MQSAVSPSPGLDSGGFRRLEEVSPMSSESQVLLKEDRAGEELVDPHSDLAIQATSVSKCYHLYDKAHDRLKQAIFPHLRLLLGMSVTSYAREFWALKDVCFEVKRGETVGIIGRNGSGKSTLLQIIAGTLDVTRGEVQVHGRVAALLELGSGFNPEFTGRENVYINAAIQGLSKDETDAKFDDIAAFADIGEFLDQPIKTYSSGMLMRLAFAVNACIEPEILVVDEALGVGDVPFQAKCYKRLRRLVDDGKSVLFVSHDISTVRSICSRALWLKNGRVELWGDAKTVSKEYERFCWAEQGIILSRSDVSDSVQPLAPPDIGPVSNSTKIGKMSVPPQLFEPNPTFEANRERSRIGTGDVIVKNLVLLNESGSPVTSCEYNEQISLHYLLEVCRPVNSDFILGIRLRDLKGSFVLSANDISSVHRIVGNAGDRFLVSTSCRVPLAHQDYVLLTGIFGFRDGLAFGSEAYDYSKSVIWDVIEDAAFIKVEPCRIMPLAGPVHTSIELRVLKIT
jgi:lipopolysaccharide transport system ATP-binding protein